MFWELSADKQAPEAIVEAMTRTFSGGLQVRENELHYPGSRESDLGAHEREVSEDARVSDFRVQELGTGSILARQRTRFCQRRVRAKDIPDRIWKLLKNISPLTNRSPKKLERSQSRSLLPCGRESRMG